MNDDDDDDDDLSTMDLRSFLSEYWEKDKHSCRSSVSIRVNDAFKGGGSSSLWSLCHSMFD